MNSSELNYTIEKLIDCEGLETVLDSIASVCIEKSEHVLSSYNDKILSVQWKKAAMAIFSAVNRVNQLL